MSIRALILDIEGTTTPITFVTETLFPYAERALGAFLARSWADEQVQIAVGELRAEASAREDLSSIDEDGPADTLSAQTAQVVRELMARDVKSTGLKRLQGLIWRAGYADGELVAPLFDDVHGVLVRMKAADIPVYIYSSGSVAAQQLLFGHTHHGDLNPLLSGYFDTTTGPKKVASSYAEIARAIGVAPAHALFATDNPDEATASVSAGMRTVVMLRPGNHALPAGHDFTLWETLDGVDDLV